MNQTSESNYLQLQEWLRVFCRSLISKPKDKGAKNWERKDNGAGWMLGSPGGQSSPLMSPKAMLGTCRLLKTVNFPHNSLAQIGQKQNDRFLYFAIYPL